MKRPIVILFAVLLFISGCATYKFQQGKAPYDKGYVVARDGDVVLEYTIGKDNSAPDLSLAKERFRRRRKTVEQYYKKMDKMKSKFDMFFWDPSRMFVNLLSGPFRVPFIAVSDYKYNHDPKYKEKMIKLQDQEFDAQQARSKKLGDQLAAYIQQDLASE